MNTTLEFPTSLDPDDEGVGAHPRTVVLVDASEGFPMAIAEPGKGADAHRTQASNSS